MWEQLQQTYLAYYVIILLSLETKQTVSSLNAVCIRWWKRMWFNKMCSTVFLQRWMQRHTFSFRCNMGERCHKDSIVVWIYPYVGANSKLSKHGYRWLLMCGLSMSLYHSFSQLILVQNWLEASYCAFWTFQSLPLISIRDCLCRTSVRLFFGTSMESLEYPIIFVLSSTHSRNRIKLA